MLWNFRLTVFMVLLALPASGTSSAPFKSLETIQFQSRDDDKLLAIGKTRDFIGVLERSYVSDPLRKNIDVYEFKKYKVLQVSKDLCAELRSGLFADSKTSSFDLKSEEILSSKSRGKVCISILRDQSPKSNIKEKHLFVVIMNLRVFGLVFRHGSQPTQSERQDQISFIESLR